MSYPRAALLLRLYTRRELPAWSRLMTIAGVNDDSRWADAPTVTVRGKWHGLKMVLDLRSQGDRVCYFIGRYLDTASQKVLTALLRPGETFIDVGANTGMMTLTGAAAVGPTGVVHAFEPYRPVFERMKRTVEANGLNGRVVLHNAGLGAEPAVLELHVPAGHPDMATLGRGLKSEYAHLKTAGVECRIARGDEALAGAPADRPATIKIDVEGYEAAVLRGLEGTIERLNAGGGPAVLTEVDPELLAGAGATAEEVAGILEGHGYRGYWIRHKATKPVSFVHWTWLERMGAIGENRAQNVVWVRPGSVHEGRIQGLVRG